MPEYIPRAILPEGLDAFTVGYLECAEWAGLDEEGQESLELSVTPKWNAESLAEIVSDCAAFQRDHAADLEGVDPAQAGVDFHLTRNHHGAGFWDRGLGARGDRLTKAAYAYGSTDVWFDPDSETLSEE